MITSDSIGLDSRLHLPTTAEVAVVTGSPPPTGLWHDPQGMDITQQVVHKLHAALDPAYGGGYDLSQIGTPLPVPAAYILDHVREILRYWARWPSEHALVVATLWVAHTWFTDLKGTLLFPATPRLLFVADPDSGKSRMLELIAAMSRNCGGLSAGEVTGPGVRNALDAKETVIIDEITDIFSNGYQHGNIRALLTSGYRPSGKSLNGYGGVGRQSNFGPVAMGSEPSIVDTDNNKRRQLEALFSRCFIIRPEKSREKVPQIDSTFGRHAKGAREALFAWSSAETAGMPNVPLDGTPPEELLWNLHSMPEKLSSRNYEISLALCAVADRAVDYAHPEGSRDRVRWSIMAREAVCGMLLGTDDGQRIIGDIQRHLEELRALNAT